MKRSQVRQDKRRQATQRRQRQRILAVVAVIAVLTVLAVVLLTRPQTTASQAEITPYPAQTWPAGEANSIGPADAAVVLKEFSDYQCPVCKRFHDDVFPKIVEEYIATGKVRYEHRNFLVIDMNTGGKESRQAATAAQCAGEQDRYWDYNGILFANQSGEGRGAFNDSRLRAFAVSLGLDSDAFNSCLTSGRYEQMMREDEAAARQLNINGTPSLVINNTVIPNPLDYAQIKGAIDTLLAQSGN